MRTWQSLCALLVLLAFTRPNAVAHHAFAAEFEARRPITLTGTVVKVAWLNPHARFYMDVKGKRSAEHWEFLLGSPNLLIRQGWSRDFLKAGEVVTITGFQARDGSRLAAVRTIRMPDGHVADFGSAGDGGPEH